jgi:hypothetical protein
MSKLLVLYFIFLSIIVYKYYIKKCTILELLSNAISTNEFIKINKTNSVFIFIFINAFQFL